MTAPSKTPRTDALAAKLYDNDIGGSAAALALLDHARKLEISFSDSQTRLRDEEERHAALQMRCYEGFPSISDGIFDALKEADAKVRSLELDGQRMRGILREMKLAILGYPMSTRALTPSALLASIRKELNEPAEVPK